MAVREFRGWQDALERQGAAFQRRHPGVSVEVLAMPLAEFEQRLLGGGEPEWDVVLALTDWLPQLMGDGILRDLSAAISDAPPPGWPDCWMSSLRGLQTDSAGRSFALPYHDGPEVLLYRRDLFDDPSEQTSFASRFGRPLTLPSDWGQFREVAEHFSRPDEGRYGCLLAGAPDGHNNVYDFLLQLWSRGGDLFHPDGSSAVGDAVAVDSMNYLIELVTAGLTQPDPRRDDSVATGERYAAGEAAMMVNWSGYSAMADRVGSPTRGVSGCAPLPGGTGPESSVSLSVYWVLGVLASSRHNAPAYEFIRHATSPDMDRITARSGATACRTSTWRDPEILAEFPFYAALEGAHSVARTLPPLRSWARLNGLLNDAVDAAHVGGDSSAALAACANAMDKESWT